MVVDLYKVRDQLQILHNRDAQAKLLIKKDDWSFFGRVLNTNGLRHAVDNHKLVPVSRDEVDKLFALARQWLVTHLNLEGLL
jgi:hypothetical protein